MYMRYSTLAFCIVTIVYYQLADRELPRNFLVDTNRRQVGHPWNKLFNPHNTHIDIIIICHSAQQSSITRNIRAVYFFHLGRKKIYDKVTRIIIDCDECSTYWQNHFDFFVNKKHSKENTCTIISTFVTSSNHSQENFVIEIKQIPWSNLFQK